MKPPTPLVSCIMPTYNRWHFVPRAIHQFMAQDYPHRELVIVDDGEKSIKGLVPKDPRIRYLRRPTRMSLGAKRNLACEQAAGKIIVHWDDDDWMAPWRLSYQLENLLASDADICGLSRMLFHDPETAEAWEYVYPERGRRWLAGGSLCYTKALWQRRRFDAINVGEDNRFLWKNPQPRLLALEDNTFYVARVHAGNTSRKRTSGRRWRPYPIEKIRQLLGEEAEEARSNLVAQPVGSRSAGSQTELPLVSCIMATGDRHDFLRQAIRYYQRQTYENKELIVIDDGRVSSADLVPRDDSSVHYHRLERHTNLGRKLNLGIERSSGTVIQKLDDDDYYHPKFLAATVSTLLAGETKSAIVGMDSFLVLLSETNELRTSGKGWCAGASLCFFRELWQKKGFRDIPKAVDARFLTDHMVPRLKVENTELMIVVRHNQGHLWTSQGRSRVNDRFQRQPLHSKSLAECVPAEDLAFYQSLVSRSEAKAQRTPPKTELFQLHHRGPATAGLVSVVIPVHNCEAHFFEACLASIRAQDHPGPIELIVVDDGSEAHYETGKIARRHDVDHMIVLPTNQGACAARNIGWLSARGETTLFFDADDRLRPAAICALSAALDKHPQAALAYSDFEVNGRTFAAGPFTLEHLRQQNKVAIACLVRTGAFVGFNPAIPRGMDWDAWLRMAKLGKTGVKASGVLFDVTTERLGRITDTVDWNTYQETIRRHHPDIEPMRPTERRPRASDLRRPRQTVSHQTVSRQTVSTSGEGRTVVTAIVVYHNSQPWFEVFLRSLLRRKFSHRDDVHLRVLLIENPCRDECPRLAREFQGQFGDNAAVIRSGLRVDRRGGGDNHAHGLAVGFRHVRPDSEWALFLDADLVLLRDGWLDALLDTGGDMVGPPAFAHLRDYDLPHAHPSFLLFRSHLARPPFWDGDFRHRLRPPDGSEYWDTAIPFTMAMGQRPDVRLVRLPQKCRVAGEMEYFQISDLAMHIRGVSNLPQRPKNYSAKKELLRLPEVRALLSDEIPLSS